MILVIDNFIKDQDLLNDISNDDNLFSDPGVYYWWMAGGIIKPKLPNKN